MLATSQVLRVVMLLIGIPDALPNSMNKSFYKRRLPEPPSVAFSSPAGRRHFQSAMSAGYLDRFFDLVSHFQTQAEPAYCGVSTLVIVLNAMQQDPKRIWKGVWRYYHESMLSCCVPLDVIKDEGITMPQLACLASCNGAEVDVTYALPSDSSVSEDATAEAIERFREVVKRACSAGDDFIIVSYGRSMLLQSGDGHFSPIGAYDPVDDLVLILDVARFKYPPHWVSLQLLYQAMQMTDAATGRPRGYMVLVKRQADVDDMPIYFVITQRNHSWRQFASTVQSIVCAATSTSESSSRNIDLEQAVRQLAGSSIAPDVVSLFSTYISEFGLNHETTENQDQVAMLLGQLRTSQAFALVSASIDVQFDQDLAMEVITMLLLAMPSSSWAAPCCRIEQAGCFDIEQLPDPLRNEVLAIRHQLDALMAYCAPHPDNAGAICSVAKLSPTLT